MTEDAAKRVWDLVVVGAGPAGSLAAREAARRGASVLLVDKAAFPREKLCGCCVNARALATLERVGLGARVAALGGAPLQTLRLGSGGRWMDVGLPGGVAVSRGALDSMLAAVAVDAGVSFTDRTAAQLEHLATGDELHRVTLVGARFNASVVVETRVVVVADGLAGRALAGWDGFDARVDEGARVGVGAILPADACAVGEGVVQLACGDGGYVGLVRLCDGRIDLAAAVDAELVRFSGGPSGAVMRVLAGCEAPPVEGLEQAAWRGAPCLTRRRGRLAGRRLFIVGDAAGYVEPFTGEGIAWALVGGEAVAELAVMAVNGWSPALENAWERRHRALVRDRQWVCRAAAALLRRPRLLSSVLQVAALRPALVRPLVKRVNRVDVVEGGGIEAAV